MRGMTHAPLEGIHNFRAVAPYPLRNGRRIRPNMIFRFGAPDFMTESDRRRLKEELRVARLLDLRHRDELGEAGIAHLMADCALHLSVFPAEGTQADLIAELNGLYGPGPSPARYLHYLKLGGPAFARIFGHLAEPETYPVVIHCTAGKDRTGVVIGMLMEILGAHDGDIAHEYALSNAEIDRFLEFARASGRVLEGSDEEIRRRLETPPDRMLGFLELLRKEYGGSEAYLRGQGVPAEAFAAMRDLLVE